jgi:hypothetical protein
MRQHADGREFMQKVQHLSVCFVFSEFLQLSPLEDAVDTGNGLTGCGTTGTGVFLVRGE